MRDITSKFTTLRTARAEATLTAQPSTLAAVREGQVPKGDPLPVAKVAAVLAAKKTTEWIPYCHNIPIEGVSARFDLGEDRIVVTVEVSTIAKTGVEMEALTAASAAVLTLYDMLKMLDDEMEIVGVRLLEKRGGKSDLALPTGWTALVVVASDRAARGQYEDLAGPLLVEGLTLLGARSVTREVVPDEPAQIRKAVQVGVEGRLDVVLVTGGTGVGPRDRTPEAIAELIERRLPGVEETLRRYGQDRFPTAMLSRSVAGVIRRTVVLAIPGSPSACRDALSALFPALLHAVDLLSGAEE